MGQSVCVFLAVFIQKVGPLTSILHDICKIDFSNSNFNYTNLTKVRYNKEHCC